MSERKRTNSGPPKIRLNCGVCGRIFWTVAESGDLAGEEWDICRDCDEPMPERTEVALNSY